MSEVNTVLMSKVFILNGKSEILVLRRSASDPKWALDWDLPGGAIETAEDPKLTAKRESYEEAGVIINSEDLVLVDVSSLSDGQPAITITYYTDSYRGTVRLSWEHDSFKWVTFSDFMHLVIPDKYKIAARRLATLLSQ